MLYFFPLDCIFRQSLDQSKLPDIWKWANFTPIYKKCDKANTCNYRPGSLTSQVCTIFEKLVKEKLLVFTKNIIANEQHGFRRGRSCLTNLLVTLEEWKKTAGQWLSV